MIHHGSSVTCNCCGHSFRAFRYLGYGEKPVGACWYCDSHPRMRMLKDYLETNFNDIIKGRKILHIAPELQIYKWLKAIPNVSYTAGDKHAKGYRYPKSVVDLDITSLPFEDNSFDVVICNHVLEHVKNDAQAIQEIFRVLRPGGRAILLIPIDKELQVTLEEPVGTILSPEERIRLFGQFDHVRQYGLDYYDKLKSHGFRIEIIPSGQEEIAKFGLYAEEDMIVGSKP